MRSKDETGSLENKKKTWDSGSVLEWDCGESGRYRHLRIATDTCSGYFPPGALLLQVLGIVALMASVAGVEA